MQPTMSPTPEFTMMPTLQPTDNDPEPTPEQSQSGASVSPTPEPSPEVSAAPTPEGTHYSLLIVLAHQWILHTSMSFIHLYVSKTKRE